MPATAETTHDVVVLGGGSGGYACALRAVTATLAADHRVSNGHRGARFLAEINRLLQAPEAR
mgnify:CR=1 FL=1